MTDVTGADLRRESLFGYLSFAKHPLFSSGTGPCSYLRDLPYPFGNLDFVNASWFEREVFDLFGVLENHPNLRRILQD